MANSQCAMTSSITINTSSLLINYYIITFILFSQIDLTSTMNNSPQTLPQAPKTAKFPKSNSFSSIKTQPDFFFDKDFSSRKVSQGQKLKLISLVTADNYSMKSAAKFVKVSYSTAKKVFTKFRQDRREEMKKKAAAKLSNIRAGYSTVPSINIGLVKVVWMTAGEQQGSTNDRALVQNSDC